MTYLNFFVISYSQYVGTFFFVHKLLHLQLYVLFVWSAELNSQTLHITCMEITATAEFYAASITMWMESDFNEEIIELRKIICSYVELYNFPI